ncbi:MAG TPA: mandelate racemase/muconate lactonizing enzyme family protein [Thermomicrobiales bacterium]|nr:mandelate racemase/muconate lactonizing enzyme family protein [Thermomicrobiales bacterium]
MKIVRIETHLGEGQQIAVVKVFTDQGAEGIGQTSTYGAAITVEVLHTMVAPHFLGQNPWDLERIVDRVIRDQYKFPGTFIHRALCGIDTAIWDLLGKITGQPVYRLLGGLERAEVPMYASSMRRDASPEAEVQRFASAIERDGFRCIKLRIGDKMGRDVDAAPGRTEAIIREAREGLGDALDIHADANSGFSAARAIRVGRMLEEYRYFHFEEPCPYKDLEATAEVAAALDMPVAGGEQDYDLFQFRRMIAMGAVDIVQPDIGYIGGVSRARRVAEMAAIAGIPCTPHCANRSLQMFTLHLAAAMPACYQYHEWSIEPDSESGWAASVWEPMLAVKDGVVQVPHEPGWGMDVQPAWLAKATLRVSTT